MSNQDSPEETRGVVLCQSEEKSECDTLSNVVNKTPPAAPSLASPQNEPLGQNRTIAEQAPSIHVQTSNINTRLEEPPSDDRSRCSLSLTSAIDIQLQQIAMPSLPLNAKEERNCPLNPTPKPPRKSEAEVTSMKRNRTPEIIQPRNGSTSSQRARLLVFIKIILKCLDYEDPSLHLEAKHIVMDCTRKNREGVPGYDSLADVITGQLRMAVGDLHWNRAEGLMSHYLKTRPRSNNNMEKARPKRAAV